MANVFAITTAAQTLKTDAGGQASIVFTVTNTTARPLRGVAKIRPLGNTQSGWLRIDGEPERDFPAGGTHQFAVSFSRPKPPAAPSAAQPAGSFPFRLDAASASAPDEDFTEGPVVAVETPGQEGEREKSFPWWILIVFAGLLIVGVVVAILLLRRGDDGGDETPPPPEKVQVANVANKTFAEAEKTLADQKLKAAKVVVSAPDKEADKVFEQDPAATKDAAAGSTVKLSVPDTCDTEAGQCIWAGRYMLHNTGQAEGNAWSITPDQRPQGHLLYGPYFSLQDYGRGKYRAFWEIKVDDNSKDLNAVTVDVYTHAPSPNTYASQTVKANQFSYPNAVQQIALDFVVTDPSLRYEFRVAYWGNVKVTIEKVGFQKM